MFELKILSPDTAGAELGGYRFTMPICPLGDSGNYIIGFDSMGKTKLINQVAELMIKEFGLHNVEAIVCPEAKAIPIAQEIAMLIGIDYFVLRKAKKAYMQFPESLEVQSITTKGTQHLWYDSVEAKLTLLNRKVMLFDDVVSTGSSFKALEAFAERENLNVVHKCAVFSEGDSKTRSDIEVLGYLPILTKDSLEKRFGVVIKD